MSKVLELTKQLISRQSNTPNDAGCQEILIERLKPLGFEIETFPYNDVLNFWAKRGEAKPLLVFAGHTDIVPPGPLEEWLSDPYTPEIRDGLLYGRGAADMKSGLAAMVIACEEFIKEHPKHNGAIGFIVTSDEEGPAVDGTRRVIEHLQERNEQIDHCIVGEASSIEQLGDSIKVGRRGTLSGDLKIFGKQGHIAYPKIAINPIHNASPAINELISTQWDKRNDYFQATSFQISNINGGTGAGNVIPGQLDIKFNFRYSTESTQDSLKERVHEILDKHQLDYQLDWHGGGNPFFSKPSLLTQAATQAVEEIIGIKTNLSTAGGTSDGRFIAPTGAEVIELGPCNQSIHQLNEHVRVDDLNVLVDLYLFILKKILA